MGWTFTHKPEGITAKEFLVKEFTEDSERASFKVLKSAVKLHVGYFQIERIIKATGERSVFALVVHIQRCPSDHHNFGWKEVEESMGPYEVDCPLDILDGLDETTSEYALRWRKDVLEYNARKKKAGIKNGQWVKFAKPISFTDGSKGQVFQCEKRGRKTFFSKKGGWGVYKISKRCLMGEGVEISNEEPVLAQ